MIKFVTACRRFQKPHRMMLLQGDIELERPVLDAFWKWIDGMNALGGSKLAKAVNYAQNQRTYMENYLLDGRCSISNNAAERAVKSYVMGRRISYFMTL